jgi:chemotaxis protein methyltransferase CheR
MMEQAEIPLSAAEFGRVKARVYEEAGIALSDAKRTLVISRLSKIVRALGLGSFTDYLDFLDGRAAPEDRQDFINALTTNLTRFWREDHHFSHLADYVKQLAAKPTRFSPDGRPRLRIWSAGCSTGQEPYTIAMTLMAALPELRNWDFRILATDIDTKVLHKAAGGIYPVAELSGLTAERARLLKARGDGKIEVPAAVRSLVAFRPLNLMQQQWPMKGPFDAVFCRNVAIYFDKPTQGAVFGRLGRIIVPGGYLYIGHSENLGSGDQGFKLVGKTIYQAQASQKARDAA